MKDVGGHRGCATAAVSQHVTDNIGRVLHAIRSHLEMDIAFVSEFLGEDRVLRSVELAAPDGPLKAGMVIPMSAGYCSHVVAGRLPELIADTNLVPFSLSIPETKTIPIGAHLSVPIQFDSGRVFGTFCCISYAPRPLLNETHLSLMRTFAAMLATQLAAEVEAHQDRSQMAARLDAAMRNDDPQIVFQPIVRLTDYTLAGVEALSRFPSDLLRGPDQWFADAHALGIGPALEILAVRKALRECALLPSPASVSVNISPETLLSQNVVEALSEFDPKRIVVEITEHVPIHDYEPVLAALAALRNIGVRIAIDDAGAGYSSLRHVLALRPDIIKFDISLTRNIDQDPTRQAMVAALSEFARRTSTDMVAEGIETEAELNAIRMFKIGSGQGYFFGKPNALDKVLIGAAARQAKEFVASNRAAQKSRRGPKSSARSLRSRADH